MCGRGRYEFEIGMAERVGHWITPVFLLLFLGGYQYFRREFGKFFRRCLRQRPAKLEDFLPHAISERLLLQGLKISSGKTGRVIAEHEKTDLEVPVSAPRRPASSPLNGLRGGCAPGGGVQSFRPDGRTTER